MAAAPTLAIADWKSLAASKRESNYNKIPTEWRLPSSLTSHISSTSNSSVLDIPEKSGLLTRQELEITENYDAWALTQLIAAGKLTSKEVTIAFCKRAAIAQQCVNCLTEIMFDEAIARATQCDEYLKKEGKKMGPLHGLPISLKDSFQVKGSQATIGYISFLSHPPSTTNSTVVDILFRAGAVFHCKTNLPQTMMTADSDNNVFGRTLNPNNPSLTAGGSTGGEGALIKMRGSVLGMATDVAGSIRIPALCNGIVGFKPSAGRIGFGGSIAPGRLGSPTAIPPVIGPEATSVRDCELVLQTIIDSTPWDVDETVLNIPWRRLSSPKTPLRFGLIRGHPQRPLHPPVARILHTAATQLKEAGHSIVLLDDQIPDLYTCTMLSFKYFLLDPQKTPVKHIQASGEPWVPSIPTCALKELEGWQPSLDELWDMNVQRMGVVRRFRELYTENRLDAVIMPGYQATAVPHDTFGVPIYTVIQNLLNYPAAILPYLKAEKALDEPFFKADAAYEPPYNPATFENAPGALQIMGKPMLDEELIQILKVVERDLGTAGRGRALE
ncbi:amidase [Lophiostoma macrostomum CBS 122681]|uniref:Amidase n=1 Tax=Lophiostoma macrostomum CBS 122681 TaxID=1314788 RepID=A0A6A6TNL3_9PLEO|nr:amidase [Lophiostoma macrostomum CBS 122681]